MIRRVICMTVAVAGAWSTVAAQQSAVFRANADGVSVSVSVRGGAKPISGLTIADFELRDDGVKQTVQALSVETLPIDVTLLLDVSRSVLGPRLERLKSSVVETSQLLGKDDRLRLIAVQHDLRLVFPFQPGGSTPAVSTLTAAGGTALFDGLVAALTRAVEPDRRQLIVAYTDGQDTISILSAESVRELAGFADAVVQIVVPISRAGTRSAEVVPGADTLRDLATHTGGQLFLMDATAPITDGFKQAIEDFRTSYVLRYVPTGVAHGGWHDLDVKVPSGTFDVRARKGYAGG